MEKINKTPAQQLEDFKKMVSLAGSENCEKCYGRGHVGYNIKLQMFIPCQCLLKAEMRIIRERLSKKKVGVN